MNKAEYLSKQCHKSSTNIIEMIEDAALTYALFQTEANNIETLNNYREIIKQLESRISVMQEVCDAAVKYKGLGMNPDLFNAVTKYEAIKE
jgi:hypothetical protein